MTIRLCDQTEMNDHAESMTWHSSFFMRKKLIFNALIL